MVLLEWVKELVDPCFDCQPRERVHRVQRGTSLLQTMRTPGHEVVLVVSPLAGLRGFAGYHSSVLVAGEEYYFSPGGICCSPKLNSHEAITDIQREFIGLSRQSGVDLLDFLTVYFRPGTYDLLRKNCNSFTDCALYFLCSQRLDPRYRQIEKLGRAADEHARLVQVVSRGEYLPNPRALRFNLEGVIAAINEEHEGNNKDSSAGEGKICSSVDDVLYAAALPEGAVIRVRDAGGYVSDGSSSCHGSDGGAEVQVQQAPGAGRGALGALGAALAARGCKEPVELPYPLQPKLAGVTGSLLVLRPGSPL